MRVCVRVYLCVCLEEVECVCIRMCVRACVIMEGGRMSVCKCMHKTRVCIGCMKM